MKFSALPKSKSTKTKRSSKKERSSFPNPIDMEEFYANSYAVESRGDDELDRYSVKQAQTSSEEEEERDTCVKEIEYAVKNLYKLEDEVSQMEMRLIKLKRSVSRASALVDADKIGVSVSFSEVEDYDDNSQFWGSYEEEEAFFRAVDEEAEALCVDPKGYFVKGVTEEVPMEIAYQSGLLFPLQVLLQKWSLLRKRAAQPQRRGRGIPLCGILSADNCAVFGNGNVKKKKAAPKAKDDKDVDDNDPLFLLEDEAPTSLDRNDDNGGLLLLEAANETPPMRKRAWGIFPLRKDKIDESEAGVPSLDNEEAAEEASIKSKRSIACGGMFPLFSDIKGDTGDESTAANSLVAKEEDDEDNNVLAIKEAPSSVSKRVTCGSLVPLCSGKVASIKIDCMMKADDESTVTNSLLDRDNDDEDNVEAAAEVEAAEAAEDDSIKSKSGIACGGMFPLFSDIKGDIGDESTAANSLVAKGEDDEDNVLAIEEASPSVSERFACGAGTIFPCRGKNDEIEVIVPDWTQVGDSFDGKSLIMQAASTPLPPSYDEASSTEM